jgi:hypothetical protein
VASCELENNCFVFLCQKRIQLLKNLHLTQESTFWILKNLILVMLLGKHSVHKVFLNTFVFIFIVLNVQRVSVTLSLSLSLWQGEQVLRMNLSWNLIHETSDVLYSSLFYTSENPIYNIPGNCWR